MSTPEPRPRIASLHPAATDTLAALGALPLLVGRTHACDLPAPYDRLPVLTRPGGISSAALEAAAPTLVLSHAPDPDWPHDPAKAVAALAGGPRSLRLSPATVEDILDDLLRVGEAIADPDSAARAAVSLRERLVAAREHVNAYEDGPRVALIERLEPLTVAGGWLVQLAERAGARHPLNPCRPRDGAGTASGMQESQRTPGPARVVTIADLAAADLDAIVLAPRGLPPHEAARTARALPGWRELPAVRRGRAAALDGRVTARASPRIADVMDWLAAWLHGRPVTGALSWTVAGPDG